MNSPLIPHAIADAPVQRVQAGLQMEGDSLIELFLFEELIRRMVRDRIFRSISEDDLQYLETQDYKPWYEQMAACAQATQEKPNTQISFAQFIGKSLRKFKNNLNEYKAYRAYFDSRGQTPLYSFGIFTGQSFPEDQKPEGSQSIQKRWLYLKRNGFLSLDRDPETYVLSDYDPPAYTTASLVHAYSFRKAPEVFVFKEVTQEGELKVRRWFFDFFADKVNEDDAISVGRYVGRETCVSAEGQIPLSLTRLTVDFAYRALSELRKDGCEGGSIGKLSGLVFDLSVQ